MVLLEMNRAAPASACVCSCALARVSLYVEKRQTLSSNNHPFLASLADRLRTPMVRRTLFLAVAVLAITQAYMISIDPALANHDVGWTLYAGGEIWDGATFSLDIIDNNPPLIYWLVAPIHGLATTLGVPPLHFYYQLVALLILGCALWCWWLLRPCLAHDLVLDTLGIVIVGALVAIPGYEYGQRDHLIMILLLPHLVAASVGATQQRSTAVRVALGVTCGIALCLKPHYLLLWLTAEIVLAMRTGSLGAWSRSENWFMAAVGVVYVAVVAVVTPDAVAICGLSSLPQNATARSCCMQERAKLERSVCAGLRRNDHGAGVAPREEVV